MKKRIGIEKLLRWAYRDELPKELARPGFLRPEGFRSPGANLVRTGDLGQSIQEPDIRNRYGVVPDFTADGSPHPDAIRIWHAVQGLAELHVDLPEGWNPLVDMGDLGPLGSAAIVKGIKQACVSDRSGVLWLRRPLHQFLEHFVIMGTVPDWTWETPVLKHQCYANGTPRWFIKEMVVANGANIEVEVDGFDKTARRPKIGAYQKPYLDPDPAHAVVARIEYRVWHAAISFLADDLAGALDEHEVTQTDRAAEPWAEGERPAPRILIDPRPVQPIPKIVRPLAGPPPYRGIGEEKTGTKSRKREPALTAT